MTERAGAIQLERFSLAILPDATTRRATAQIMARSPGIRPEHVVECRRIGQLMPLRSANPLAPVSPTLAVFRGETVDYMIVKAAAAAQGVVLLQYMIASATTLRLLGGNLALFENYAREPFGQGNMPLMPYTIHDPSPPSPEQQNDALTALLGYCRSNVKTVTGLLAGLVQGMGLSIINAPASLHDRITFLQGLLCLLPAPVRVAVTFSTHVTDPHTSATQVKFLNTPTQLDAHTVFDWRTQTVSGHPPEDQYTRFIRAQLQLDTTLVVEQTEKLARTAVWRAMRRETMAGALAWASKRAALDEVVLQRQPADRAMVAAILREDPTLSDELRVAYCAHLLSLSLALGDYNYTDIIPALAQQNKEIADNAYEQLWAAASSDRAMDVYQLVSRWINSAPRGVDMNRWRPLLGMAVTAQANTLVSGDPRAYAAFLEQFLKDAPNRNHEPMIGQLMVISRRHFENAEVARVVFLLGFAYMSIGNLQRLLSDQTLLNHLAAPLRTAIPQLRADADKSPANGLLSRAGEAYGDEYFPMIFGRLVEWALAANRGDLLDTEAIQGLERVVASPYGSTFSAVIQNAIEELSNLTTLRNLGTGAQSALIGLNLALGRYQDAVDQMAQYQDMLYQGTRSEAMGEVARAAFRQSTIPSEALIQALEFVQRGALRPNVKVRCDLGAAEGRNWDKSVAPILDRLTSVFHNDPRLIAIVGTEPVLRLLRAHAEAKNEVNALRVADAITTYALTFGEDSARSADLIGHVYQMANWSPELAEAALDVVREYVRRSPSEVAAKIPALIGAKSNTGVYKALEATYRVRLITNGVEVNTFADHVATAQALIADPTLFYAYEKDVPQLAKIKRNVDAMEGGLSEAERRRLSENLINISDLMVRLYTSHQAKFARRSKQELETRRAAITRGEVAPQSGIEVLWWIGARISEGRSYTLRVQREIQGFIFGSRSLNGLLRDSDITVLLLRGLIATLPDDAPPLDLQTFSAEVDSLWFTLPEGRRLEIQGFLSQNLQLLSSAILLACEKIHDRSLLDANRRKAWLSGRAQPRTVPEFFLWVGGYFGGQHH
ncbi:MAG: hypothetical protein OHK0023_12980 [Anaerolineae bacterium]